MPIENHEQELPHLFPKQWPAEQVRSLFRFIDWVMDLPVIPAEKFEQVSPPQLEQLLVSLRQQVDAL